MLAAYQPCHAAAARTILVFPFANQSSRADLDWISDGLAEILASRLAAPDRYVLGRDERNAAYAQLELPAGKPLTVASAYKVSEILGVDWAVMGSFNVVGTRLTAQAAFLDAPGLHLSAPIEATGELSDMVELQTQLAWRLLAAHDPDFVVGTEEAFSRSLPYIRLDAFENYIRGIQATEDDTQVRFLKEADRRNPNDHQPAFELGRFYFDRKDYPRADIWMRKLHQGDPNYMESLFLLGVSEYFLGREGAAEKSFAALVKQLPLNEVSNNLGVMESRRNDFADALVEFERAHQADPSDPDFSFNMGVCLWFLKRYDEADQSLKEALRIDDEDIGAHILLALVSGKLGNQAQQRAEEKWVADHEGDSISKTSGEENLPQTRIKKHYDGQAFRLMALAVQNAEEVTLAGKPAAEHAQFHVAKGKRLLAAGRWMEAERELAEAVFLIPDDGEVHMTLAQVLEAEGKHQEAVREMETSLKLKDSVAAHIMLARIYLSLNRAEAARTQGEAALSLDPGNHEAAQLVRQIRQRAPETRR
jgi:tetratricopeptide (TPR) repeat protein